MKDRLPLGTQRETTYTNFFKNYALRNRVIIFCHGESEANAKGIIISSVTNGLPHFGLTQKGNEQIQQAAEEARDKQLLDRDTIFIASPFLRTVESAKVAAAVAGVKHITLDPGVRERFFGPAAEETSNENYQLFWAADRDNPSHTLYGSESLLSVQQRSSGAIVRADALYTDRTIAIFTHGDVEQTLYMSANNLPLTLHRDYPTLEPGKYRELASKQAA